MDSGVVPKSKLTLKNFEEILVIEGRIKLFLAKTVLWFCPPCVLPIDSYGGTLSAGIKEEPAPVQVIRIE